MQWRVGIGRREVLGQDTCDALRHGLVVGALRAALAVAAVQGAMHTRRCAQVHAVLPVAQGASFQHACQSGCRGRRQAPSGDGLQRCHGVSTHGLVRVLGHQCLHQHLFHVDGQSSPVFQDAESVPAQGALGVCEERQHPLLPPLHPHVAVRVHERDEPRRSMGRVRQPLSGPLQGVLHAPCCPGSGDGVRAQRPAPCRCVAHARRLHLPPHSVLAQGLNAARQQRATGVGRVFAQPPPSHEGRLGSAQHGGIGAGGSCCILQLCISRRRFIC